ncbi:JmjC domain protein, partial [Myriangium duriaei CBS 260.36]
MPSQRPRAQFEPIAPNLSLPKLVEAYEHFDFCPRITFEAIKENGVDNFEKLVRKHVITEGKPLVVEGFQNELDRWTFSSKWLKDNVGDKVENARDLNGKEFIPLTIRHYLNNINAVTNQHFRPQHDRAPQRIYLKDIDCPDVWQQKLAEVIPPFLFYLNDSTGEYGGPGASVISNATVTGRRLGKGIAPAGDLMSSLPQEMRAENLMCYIGHEGTYTPSHREMCATMGHNIMVEASTDLDEDGKVERPGSSIWFMTEAKDRHTVAEFWLSKLGHDIETENHFAQINSWKLAPFKVYIVEQRPGDFILIPPLAPHQVWNRGTRTMKVAWNRSTVETLEMAMSEALPKARIVCRDEQYKNKAMIYYTLSKYSGMLSNAKKQAEKLPPDAGRALLYKGKVRNLQKEFRRLFSLFKDILLSEMFSPDGTGEKCEFFPFESNVTCAYCRGNIFNRFLSCSNCKDALGHADDEPYDVCMECYAMGRSCYCVSGHQWVEQFKWKELTGKYEHWRKQIIDLVGDVDRSTPLPLLEERKRLNRKTLAEVVREQLKRRPFIDPKKPKEDQEDEEPTDEEVIVDDDGRVKKRIKKHSKTWLKNHQTCHVCKSRHENWKMARCTRCDRWWCFGSLFRGHDDMPLDVMQNPDWECAHCQGVCFAGSCRQDPRQHPYQPKGTLLGHDTKKVADARSIEVLVDFSVSNLNWIREEEGGDESVQMRRAREE